MDSFQSAVYLPDNGKEFGFALPMDIFVSHLTSSDL